MKRLGLIVALIALAAPEMASAQARACITAPEAEAMTLVAMPDILRETGRVCGARLPGTSLIRGGGSLISKYESAAQQAWPAARAAIVKLSDPAIDTLLQSDYARPLLTSLLVPFIVGRIGLEDCGTIDRLVTQLSMPGELVFDPFAGIGTVPYCAVKLGRRGYGVELNGAYFADACAYCSAEERKIDIPSLFDSLPEDGVEEPH